METELKPIEWKNHKLVLLDQTRLPNEMVYEEFETAESIWDAIKVMKVRGAHGNRGYGRIWIIFGDS